MAVLRESPWYEEIKQEGIQQTARNLLAMGLDPQQIATATGLTLEQIRQLQN
jgi:predicted transposase YdaD